MKIPADIITYDALGRGSISDSEHIARAILAERERCAKIAESLYRLQSVEAGNIAAAIRGEHP